MKKQNKQWIKAHLLRGGFYLLLALAGTLVALFRLEARVNVSHRALTFAERVAYQRAIEDVYWRHRIWPQERPDPKPSLDAVMSQAQLEKKIADYLRKSQALQDYWQRPITPEQLQAEMDRMAKYSRQPEVLRELFEALGNDPFVIAECLARPALADRLLTNWYSYDQRIHGELKQGAEAELQAQPSVDQMKQLSGKYTEVELLKNDSSDDQATRGREHIFKLDSREWDETVRKLSAICKRSSATSDASSGLRRHVAALESADAPAQSKNAVSLADIPQGVLSPLQ